MPGCSARFESTDRDRLMSQIGAHAAEEHGITTITPDILRAVQSRIVVSA
jgi:predicted small metal-binding protein